MTKILTRTVEDAGPYKFVRLFRTRVRVFVRLPLKEKPADAVLSTVDFSFCFCGRKHFKNFLPQSAA